MGLNHRSQSALEYMMTYGWAILVIVIVAAVLYSLGIFSPSSSLSTTVTGFANTPVSSAAFTNNGGLAFSVGDLVGYPIEITNVTEITASGSKITILPNITVSPSQTKVIIIPKAFSSSTQGSHESVSLTITYTEPGQVFPGPYTSTGTVSGTTPTLFFPANQTFAAVSKLTITNSQTTATPSPFQQMINVTSSTPGWAYISQDFGQNVEFFYPNGTVIPSWLENYTSTHAIWWVKVGSIPASSSITIYMGFAPSSTNLFNSNNIGEAPQLSPTYAEYDDGANIFNYYTNFAGTSLPSGWGVTQYGGSPFSYTVDNGLLLQTGSSGLAVIQYTTRPFNFQTNVLEALGAMETNGCMEFGAGLLDNDAPCGGPNSTGIGTDTNDLSYWIRPDGDDEVGFPNPIHVGTTLYVMSQWESTTQLYGEINYGDLDTTSSTFVPDTSLYISVNIAERTVLNSKMYLQWVRVRAYPPNGVMPSVSFGSVS